MPCGSATVDVDVNLNVNPTVDIDVNLSSETTSTVAFRFRFTSTSTIVSTLIVAVVLASLAHDAAAESRPRYDGTVEATLLSAPASFDPVLARTHGDITVVGLVFDTLYRVGADGAIEPHLALDLPVLDPAGTTARITLRKGVRWQDRGELAAADVAASLERARIQDRWLLAAVSAVRADGNVVELTLRAAVTDLPALLALPQTAITRSGKPPGERPVGTGPFAVDAFDAGKHRLALRAFDDHFAGRPYTDLVLRWYDTPDGEARRFETGDAQISARGVAAFAGAQPAFRAETIEGPASVLEFVGFGASHAALADRAFRRALDLALVRAGLATLGAGERVVAARTPVPAEAGGPQLASSAQAGDLDGARAQLADAAQRVPELAADRLAQLHLEVLVDDTRPDDRELAARVVRALDKLGIAAAITALPATALRERAARGQCDLWIGQLAAPVAFASAWWASAFAAGHDDWPVAQLATGALDRAAAATAFGERMPIVPLMFRAVRLWHRSDVRGLTFDASGRPSYAELFFFGAPVRTKAH
jgi:peptide/nickel transport system substrate-binding protein